MANQISVELDAQYRQLKEECGLLDRSERGKLAVDGPEAAEYLQGQLTNDVEALSPGEGCYAALLDRKGHIQSDMRVLRLGEKSFWLDTEPPAAATVLRHLQTYKIGREVEVEDVGAERAIFSLIGPGAAQAAGAPPPPRFGSAETTVGAIACLAVGTADGVDLIADSAQADGLRGALLEAGAAEVEPEAVEMLRIEAGTPRFGAEMGIETMPAEAGIVETAISFSKGCYIGQEPVARLQYKGRPNRRLRGLRLSAPAEPGTELRLDEKPLGVIGSSCVSPAFGPIALAVLRREAESGDRIVVGEDGVTARVVDLPFG